MTADGEVFGNADGEVFGRAKALRDYRGPKAMKTSNFNFQILNFKIKREWLFF